MQRRVLVRAPNLAAFRRALVDRALAGGPLMARRRTVIVPTRAAGELLRQTIEQHVSGGGGRGLVCPDLVTRDEWFTQLHAALPGHSRWLSRMERHILLVRAAERTVARRRLKAQPFHVRPGLVEAMLDFHDELKRRQRSVSRLARVLFDELRVERGTDRGSESLINQTCFLGFTFLAYARSVQSSGGLDEHLLRSRLLEVQPELPFDDIVVAVADHPADPRGLWPADFDLIGRLRHLRNIEVVMTDEAHDAGFRARLEDELPGIEEVRATGVAHSPSIMTTEPATDPPVFLSRDREEELRDVARAIRARAEAHDGHLAGPTAIVFHRPLPYLYLAQQVMADARVPYQAFDALPLAAEPYAALLDLILTVVRTAGARAAVVALLRSKLVVFHVDGHELTLRDVAALEWVLSERRVTGDGRSFLPEVEAFAAGMGQRRRTELDRAQLAARAASAVIDALEPCSRAGTASGQVATLARFLRTHERAPVSSGAAGRVRRARAAVLAVLDSLAEVFARYDVQARAHDALASLVHHAVESQTFAPGRHHGGVHLVDAVAARFGEFDDVFLVGLVETDWAERPRRSVFYAPTLLKALGWPQEQDQMAAQRAAFRDVLTLARERTRLSAFALEGDTVVALSTMIASVAGLPLCGEPPVPRAAVFADEVLTRAVPPVLAEPEMAEWLSLRHDRPALTTDEYSGRVAPRPAEVYRVSRVDRYVVCPFKYFAEHVLGLPEERDEPSGLSPLERGTLMHAIFERFYGDWQTAGRGAITAENLPDAERLFAAVTDQMLASLPSPDRALERMRLVGSVVGPGVADRVFESEVAADAAVDERLLEAELSGEFRFPVLSGLDERRIQIRGKTDRIDVLADGTLRVIDYKLGRMPDVASSVQLGVYAHCARQWIEARDGRTHPVSAAAYLAFGDERQFEGRLGRTPHDVDMAVSAKAGAFAGTIGRIEAGEFPPRPRTPSECQWCGYAGVCRKEYRMEDDEPTESL